MKQETKDKLLKIPVIGQLAALAMMPGKIFELRDCQQAIEAQQKSSDERQRIANERWDAATATFDSLGSGIRGVQQQAADQSHLAEERWKAAGEQWQTANERWESTRATFDSLGNDIRGVQQQAEMFSREAREDLERAREELAFDRGFAAMVMDVEKLTRLRSQLSAHPAVWGDPARLHIDPEAAVDPCLFNTNSGEITVGPFSFAGPGVSLIAGTHDMALRDFPRRDLSPAEGCDIVIGRGVWLCANCTVLGPVRIGDHAVIAAGAVVIPGSEVEPGSIWGGVPAKRIGSVREPEPETAEKAFDCFGGCLYTKGWHMSETIRHGDAEITGHWMIAPEAEIQLKPGKGTLHYASPLGENENRTLTVETDSGSFEFIPKAEGEIPLPDLPDDGITTVRLKISSLTSPVSAADPRKLGLFIY